MKRGDRFWCESHLNVWTYVCKAGLFYVFEDVNGKRWLMTEKELEFLKKMEEEK